MADQDSPPQHPSRLAVAMAAIDAAARVLRAGVFAGAFLGGTWMLREPLMALAGKSTAVRLGGELAISAELPIDVSVEVNWLGLIVLVVSVFSNVVLGGIVIGQRRNNAATVRALADRATRLESLIDPNRSSSGLTPEGRTNPMDR